MEVMENKTIPTVVDANQLDELLRERHDLRLLDVRTPSTSRSTSAARTTYRWTL